MGEAKVGERVRWDGLFADLEAQADGLAAAERSAEVEERVRIEVGQIGLVDRLRPAVGGLLRVRCLGGLALTGRLQRVGVEWCLIDEGAGREAILATQAMVAVSGLGRLSAPACSAGLVQSRLGIRHVLRGVARDRSTLRIHLIDGSIVDGTLDRVGADFVEIAAHPAGELRRRAEVLEVLVLAIATIAVVRRDG
jgi:hypothetical protein